MARKPTQNNRGGSERNITSKSSNNSNPKFFRSLSRESNTPTWEERLVKKDILGGK